MWEIVFSERLANYSSGRRLCVQYLKLHGTSYAIASSITVAKRLNGKGNRTRRDQIESKIWTRRGIGVVEQAK